MVGFRMAIDYSNIIGVCAAVVAFVAFMLLGRNPVAGAPDDAECMHCIKNAWLFTYYKLKGPFVHKRAFLF